VWARDGCDAQGFRVGSPGEVIHKGGRGPEGGPGPHRLSTGVTERSGRGANWRLAPPAARHPIRVAIVENHELVSESLGPLLDGQPDLEVVARVASVREAAGLARTIAPDVVVIDFHLDDGTGRDAVVAMRQKHPGARYVFLSRDSSDIAQLAAIEAGASAYLCKSAPALEVIAAVRRVAQGESLITPAVIASTLVRSKDRETLTDSLSRREREVLQLMAERVSTGDIAHRLGISYSTVRTHVRSINCKLGTWSMLNSVVAAHRLELVN